ncbi:MAG: HipA domain-containing protein [Clostridiales Family XIII bacterium]|jgi:hypothetical protein|nr:HipA domain-containing protein [Clostridiales Family XIII bacterium]
MDYTLMHREMPVMEIEIDEETGVISKIGELINAPHLPVGLKMVNGIPSRRALNEWWTGRAIPASRVGLRDALKRMNVSSPQFLLTRCFGLSLSDQYWVRSEKKLIEWKDVNFFDNAFSDDVGEILFGGMSVGRPDLMSPDNTSDGWLKKKWIIVNGERWLVKDGSPAFYQEPLNEALASAIMRRLGVAHAHYNIVYEHGRPFSVCADFVGSETDLVSARSIISTAKRPKHISEYRHYLDCCERLGIPGVEQSLNEMLTVDFLIANTDRHFNNFGAIRNAETLEWIGAAPVFDCGASMYYDRLTELINPRLPGESKPFCPSHDEQIKLVTDFGWLSMESMHGIDEEYSDILKGSEYIDGARRANLCSAIETRVGILRDIVAGAF